MCLPSLCRLYPLTQGENATPKALLPIGDEVMIDRVLAWVEESGIVGEYLGRHRTPHMLNAVRGFRRRPPPLPLVTDSCHHQSPPRRLAPGIQRPNRQEIVPSDAVNRQQTPDAADAYNPRLRPA
jgi:hypothetical protein